MQWVGERMALLTLPLPEPKLRFTWVAASICGMPHVVVPKQLQVLDWQEAEGKSPWLPEKEALIGDPGHAACLPGAPGFWVISHSQSFPSPAGCRDDLQKMLMLIGWNA